MGRRREYATLITDDFGTGSDDGSVVKQFRNQYLPNVGGGETTRFLLRQACGRRAIQIVHRVRV